MRSITPIKYDLNKKTEWKILLIISLVIIVPCIVLLFSEQFAENIIDIVNSDLLAILFTAMYIAIPLFIISILSLINISVYLKRLEQNHFEVPKNRWTYDNDLLKLPRTEVVENKYAVDSKTGAQVSVAVYITFVIIDFLYMGKWVGIEEDCISFFVLLMIMHLFFLIFAVVLFRQRNTAVYVDNTDIAFGRKVRISISKTICVLVVTSIIAIIGLILADRMTEYVHKSRQQESAQVISILTERASMDDNDLVIDDSNLGNSEGAEFPDRYMLG